jgi:hypothetical protein
MIQRGVKLISSHPTDVTECLFPMISCSEGLHTAWDTGETWLELDSKNGSYIFRSSRGRHAENFKILPSRKYFPLRAPFHANKCMQMESQAAYAHIKKPACRSCYLRMSYQLSSLQSKISDFYVIRFSPLYASLSVQLLIQLWQEPGDAQMRSIAIISKSFHRPAKVTNYFYRTTCYCLWVFQSVMEVHVLFVNSPVCYRIAGSVCESPSPSQTRLLISLGTLIWIQTNWMANKETPRNKVIWPFMKPEE